MRKVRINRAKWRCGGFLGHGSKSGSSDIFDPSSTYLNDGEFRCCLGFAANQLGRVSYKDMLYLYSPAALSKKIEPFSENDGSFLNNTKFAHQCMIVNDDASISNKMREYKLKRKFKSQDIDLQFYGKYNE